MPISVRCESCGQGHKAPDILAGKTLKCRKCGDPLTVPEAVPAEPEFDAAQFLLQSDDAAPAKPSRDPYPEPESIPSPAAVNKKSSNVSNLPPLTTNDPPLWRRYLHWVLVLALLPLAVSMLSKPNEEDILDRLLKSMKDASPAEQQRFEDKLLSAKSIDDIFVNLPGQKLDGAFLSRSTSAHWLMALAATILYMVFFMYLASDGSAKALQVLTVGLITATVGVGLLLLVQWIASFTDGRILVGKSIVVLFFYIFKFIAFSYSAASDPENGFLLSFLGYTLGVGLLEELTKTIPLFWHRNEENGRDSNWRGIFIWGLASGAGFGIAEGIIYSSRYYNGITGPGIYGVRFLSCVALHAIWSGSVAITLYLKRDHFDSIDEWYGWIGPTLAVIAVPMSLHGLYDTCLKKDQNGLALLVAVASFGFLAFLTSRLYGKDDEAAKAAMLKEYKRRKSAMA